MGEVVAVTGANGFLASHIVDLLLSAGYRVHATVRDANDATKMSHLLELARKHGAVDRLRLFSADLMKPGSFDDAFRGCHVVIHSAMPVTMTARDPQRTIVDPALQGVVNVVNSVERNANTIHRLIYTSSTECIGTTRDAAVKGATFTEKDWNTDVWAFAAYLLWHDG